MTEEFEFKPLSEGLGFHRPQKDVFTPERIQKTPAMPQAPIERPSSKAIDDILETLNYKKQYDFASASEELRKAAEAAPVYKSSTWEVAAGLLDLMLILAAQLTCLIILLLTTHVDLMTNMLNPDENLMIYVSLFSLFAGISWIYLVANRMFLGFTPGEWVFDQRLGRPEDMAQNNYSLKVAVRSTVIVLTGFVVLPVLSALFNRDLLGRMMGLELVKKA